MARCPIRAKVEIRSVSGGLVYPKSSSMSLVYLCQFPADCFFKRRTTFIGDGVDSWQRRRGSSGMETGDGCSVLFTRLITFKDGRLFKEAVVLF